MTFTVLGDSDDFLMLELRERDTAKLELSPGWPAPKRIAARLARFAPTVPRIAPSLG